MRWKPGLRRYWVGSETHTVRQAEPLRGIANCLVFLFCRQFSRGVLCFVHTQNIWRVMMWRLAVILTISQICIEGWGRTDVLEPLRILDHGESILDAALSPDGTLVLTGGADGSAKLWNAGTGELLRTFVCHERGITCTFFSPDGRRVLTGGHDRVAKLWEAETGEFIRALEGHDGTITSAAFSPDGALILTGGSDGAVKLWWGDSGNLLHTFEEHTGKRGSGLFYGGWHVRILTGCLDGAIRMWDARDRWRSSIRFRFMRMESGR